MSQSPSSGQKKQRVFDFNSPARKPDVPRAYVSKSGQATSLFLQVAKVSDKDACFNALKSITLRGTPRISEKNQDVYYTLIGSNKHIAKAMTVVESSTGVNFEMDDKSMNFFNQPPQMFWRMAETGYNLKVTGNLYLFDYFLRDENSFNANVIVDGTEYIIPLDDDFDAETCTTKLKELCDIWGWATPCAILRPSASPSTSNTSPATSSTSTPAASSSQRRGRSSSS